ncbi:protein-tyrosine phosphatase family protein [Arthrobacter halodurans]|uniref:Dual specificity protein phosphatase family protein n=1 Tax=Arthrobacter halodurans TaxID=516699 RepID=A0ABV4UM25_9MICC
MTVRANLSWVAADLAVGGDLSYDPAKAAAQFANILASGVTHIVDMRSEANDAARWSGSGVEYKWLGTDDRAGHTVDPRLFDAGVRFARTARRSGGKVLAHCHMGVNRGPSMGFAILLDRGHGAVEAFEMIRAARPQAFIAYAEDALLAHGARHVAKGGHARTCRRELKLLRAHVAETMTPSKVGFIQRAMRQHRLDDLRPPA